jgi:hypothetical protein
VASGAVEPALVRVIAALFYTFERIDTSIRIFPIFCIIIDKPDVVKERNV